MIDVKNFQPSKFDLGGYYLGDYYHYFKKHEMIVID